MSLVPPIQRPSQIQQVVLANLDYAEESDAAIALVKARKVIQGLRQLMLVRPAEMQQGGVGRGSGFSMAWDPQGIHTLIAEAKAFVTQRTTSLVDVFGVYAADTTSLQSTCVEGCEDCG